VYAVVTIRNTQRRVAIDVQALQMEVMHIMAIIGYPTYDIGIWITNNRTIRHYNKLYRHKNKPTDILSFPYYPELKPGEHIQPATEEDKNIGDLIISAEYIVQEAKRYNTTFNKRLQLLVVHGICHLLGYDHLTEADFRRMRAKEAAVLRKLKPARRQQGS
jgi:probable rRNA maturation factor